MEAETINQIGQIVVQGMISIVFIWAWSQERKERQDHLKSMSVERDVWMKELIDLAREAYGLKSRIASSTSAAAPLPHVLPIPADGDRRQ